VLKEAVDKALERNAAVTSGSVFVNDGEGYMVTIKSMTDVEMRGSAAPYYGEFAMDRQRNGPWSDEDIKRSIKEAHERMDHEHGD